MLPTSIEVAAPWPPSPSETARNLILPRRAILCNRRLFFLGRTMIDFVNTTSRGYLGRRPLARSSNKMKVNASEWLARRRGSGERTEVPECLRSRR
jgi:hypothetical protein